MFLKEKARLRSEMTDMAITVIEMEKDLSITNKKIAQYNKLLKEFTEQRDIDFLLAQLAIFEDAKQTLLSGITQGRSKIRELKFHSLPCSYLFLKP